MSLSVAGGTHCAKDWCATKMVASTKTAHSQSSMRGKRFATPRQTSFRKDIRYAYRAQQGASSEPAACTKQARHPIHISHDPREMRIWFGIRGDSPRPASGREFK